MSDKRILRSGNEISVNDELEIICSVLDTIPFPGHSEENVAAFYEWQAKLALKRHGQNPDEKEFKHTHSYGLQLVKEEK